LMVIETRSADKAVSVTDCPMRKGESEQKNLAPEIDEFID
jgi:hypothetical protein